MFNNLVESSGVRRGARSFRFFVGTAAVWSAALVTGIAVGIMAFDAKVSADFENSAMLSAVVPPPAPPPPPPPPGPTRPQGPITPVSSPRFESLRAEPTRIAPQPASPPVRVTGVGIPGGLPEGSNGGEVGGSGVAPGGPISDVPATLPPPQAPPVVRETEPQRPVARQIIRSSVLAGKATQKAQPIYPPMAKAAGIEGAVVVEVLVDEQGRVLTTRTVSGHPLLAPEALRAARNWSFSPTLLNGVPVKVVGTITFNFRKN